MKTSRRIQMPDDYPWTDKQLVQKCWWASGVAQQLRQAAEDNDAPNGVIDDLRRAQIALKEAYHKMEQHVTR